VEEVAVATEAAVLVAEVAGDMVAVAVAVAAEG